MQIVLTSLENMLNFCSSQKCSMLFYISYLDIKRMYDTCFVKKTNPKQHILSIVLFIPILKNKRN